MSLIPPCAAVARSADQEPERPSPLTLAPAPGIGIARELLESVLRLHGAVIEAGPGNLQRIVPAAKSGRSETSPVELLSVPGYTAAEALDMLKSFLPEGTNISVLPRSGMLAVRDGSPALLAKARALAEALGRSGPAGWPGMVIPIHEALPSRLALEQDPARGN